jgi:hypothetical protein
LVKINQSTAFVGEATLQLLGIPPKVTTTDMKLTKDTKEVVFTLKTEANSPVGKHNLICRLTITQNGEPIVSRAGTVQFQIDKPLPPPPNAPKPKPKPVEKTVVAQAKPEAKPAPPPKPLSRLEKLRLAAKQRQDARNAANAGGGGGE